jgi:hypothetical protein
MTRRLKTFLTFGCALAGLLLFAGGVGLAGHSAHAQSPVMRVDPAAQTVDVGGGKFTVNILIDNVTNLGAYEVQLSFDPDILRLVGVEDAGFLGSSGRQLHCPSRFVETTAKPADTLRFGCATNNAEPPGPDGSGILATVAFAPRKAGYSPLKLGVQTGWAPPLGQSTSVVTEGGEVTVVGNGPPATPEPNEPTPIPTSPHLPALATPTPGDTIESLLTPEPGQTPMSRPMPGGQMTKPSADSVAAASVNSESSGGNQGSPRAGTGPERESSRWPTITGLFLMAGGVALLSFAAFTRRSRKNSTG